MNPAPVPPTLKPISTKAPALVKEADAADTKIPSTAGTSISKYIFALYQQRLNEESSKLMGQYPIRPHRID